MKHYCPGCGDFVVENEQSESNHTYWCKVCTAKTNPISEGIKYDQEKIQLELLSATWLYGVGSVLSFGAKKYAVHNWRKGIQMQRLLGATLRHVVAFLGGEDLDQETGLSHLYHASCCLMFASELYKTRPDLDDRYKVIVHHPDNRMHRSDCNFKPCPGGMECINRVFDNIPQEKINSDT